MGVFGCAGAWLMLLSIRTGGVRKGVVLGASTSTPTLGTGACRARFLLLSSVLLFLLGTTGESIVSVVV